MLSQHVSLFFGADLRNHRARLAKKDVVICLRIKRPIQRNKIEANVGKFFAVRKPFQIVAEIQAVHSGQISRDSSTSLGMTSPSAGIHNLARRYRPPYI